MAQSTRLLVSAPQWPRLAVAVSAAALALAAQPGAAGHSTPPRQTMRFYGNFIVGPGPAVKEPIKVVAGTHVRDLVLCGSTTSEADGSFTLNIRSGERRCTDSGYNDGHGPVPFIFVWRGQKVGGANVHFDPSRPEPHRMRMVLHASSSPPRAVPRTDPEDVLIFGGEPEELLVPRRYFGRVRGAGGGPPRDVASVVLVNGTFPCGSAPVRADGTFVLDIVPVDDCACPNAKGSKHLPKFTFTVGGRAAWSANFHLHLDMPTTLGRTEAITLNAPWLR